MSCKGDLWLALKLRQILFICRLPVRARSHQFDPGTFVSLFQSLRPGRERRGDPLMGEKSHSRSGVKAESKLFQGILILYMLAVIAKQIMLVRAPGIAGNPRQ